MIRQLGLLGFLLVLLLACGSQERRQLVKSAPLITQSYTDDTGRSLQLPDRPARVVSLAPSITEIIFAIGAEAKLAARSQACSYPPAVADYPEVTTYPQLDLEELRATEADLLLTTDEIFTPDDLAHLERTGLPVYVQRYGNLADVYRGIRQLGGLLDRAAAAEALADSLARLEARVTDSTRGQVHYRTMVLVSNDPLKVVGGGSFINELIEKAGGLNIYAEREEAYPVTTVEEILQLQPEYLILPSKQTGIYADLLVQYPALYNTPADVAKQVFVVDPDLLYRPGPRTLSGLLELTHILHTSLTPDRFVDAP